MILMSKIKTLFRSPLKKFGAHLLWGMIAAVLFLGLFAKLVEDLLFQEVQTFDKVVTHFVQSFSSPTVTRIANFITQLGSGPVLIGLMLLAGGYFLLRLKHVWETVVLAVSFAGGGVLNLALKNIFHRTRPDITHLVEAGGYSFPSGHAMVSASFYGMLGYLLWLNLREQSKPSWYIIIIIMLLIFAIGISRIYLGVHFPSDVVAGFAAGGAWVAACIVGLHAIRYYKGNKNISLSRGKNE